jgi:hypothetical protein
MLKTGRKAQVRNKIKLGKKKVFPCEGENDLAEHCLLMERKFWGLQTSCVSLTNLL